MKYGLWRRNANMLVVLSVLLAADCVVAEISEAYALATATLPQQAVMCDMAGIGSVLSTTDKTIDLEIHTLWFGNAASNHLAMNTEFIINPAPTNYGQYVFFAMTNDWWQPTVEYPIDRILSWSFVTNPPTVHGNYLRWTLANGAKALYPLNMDEGRLCVFASKLVHAARVDRNAQQFYAIVHGGSTSTAARVRAESRLFLFLNRDFIPPMMP